MQSHRNQREITFGGETLWLDPAAAVYLPEYSTLVVSDLHLEKGSFLSQTGAPVPLYDTLDTLLHLQNLIAHYQPRQVILLGDTLHDRRALQRLPAKERDILQALVSSVPDWCWVSGNHDADIEVDIPGRTCNIVHFGNLTLSHEPVNGITPLIIGHFHPKIVTHIAGHKVKGKVFMFNESLLILPSFGSYTGGLLTTNSVFNQYLKGEITKYIIIKERIFKIS